MNRFRPGFSDALSTTGFSTDLVEILQIVLLHVSVDPLVDPFDQARSFIDQTRIDLKQVGTGFDLLNRIFGTENTPDTDNWLLIAVQIVERTDELCTSISDGHPAQSPPADLFKSAWRH